MSVNVPVFDFQKEGGGDGNIFPYGMAFTSGELDSAMLSFSGCRWSLCSVWRKAKKRHSLAARMEIERHRRRVNALENVMIPNYQETIKYIHNEIGRKRTCKHNAADEGKGYGCEKAIETKRKQEAAAFGE